MKVHGINPDFYYLFGISALIIVSVTFDELRTNVHSSPFSSVILNVRPVDAPLRRRSDAGAAIMIVQFERSAVRI